MERSADFLDAALKGIFLAIPTLKCIGYFHPEGVPLFAPFSSPKFSSSSSDSTDKHTITSDSTSASKSSPRKNGDDGGKHRAIPVRPQQTGRHNKKDKNEPFFKLINKTSKGVAYSLFTCGRSEILPQFRVRKARVEDTDDLVPMLRKQHVRNINR